MAERDRLRESRHNCEWDGRIALFLDRGVEDVHNLSSGHMMVLEGQKVSRKAVVVYLLDSVLFVRAGTLDGASTRHSVLRAPSRKEWRSSRRQDVAYDERWGKDEEKRDLWISCLWANFHF